MEYSFQVVVTARTNEKGHNIVKSVTPSQQKNVAYAIVEDIVKEGAFDVVSQDSPIVHIFG